MRNTPPNNLIGLRYLKLIICDKEFYQACDVRVKQQIWLKNDDLFLEAVHPILDSYVKEKERLLLTTDRSPTNFFTCETTKSRRQWVHIKGTFLSVRLCQHTHVLRDT